MSVDDEARHVIAEAMWIQRSPHPDTPADRYLPEADGILDALHDDGYAVVKQPEPQHRLTAANCRDAANSGFPIGAGNVCHVCAMEDDQ